MSDETVSLTMDDLALALGHRDLTILRLQAELRQARTERQDPTPIKTARQQDGAAG